jgi:hypothetical protein
MGARSDFNGIGVPWYLRTSQGYERSTPRGGPSSPWVRMTRDRQMRACPSTGEKVALAGVAAQAARVCIRRIGETVEARHLARPLRYLPAPARSVSRRRGCSGLACQPSPSDTSGTCWPSSPLRVFSTPCRLVAEGHHSIDRGRGPDRAVPRRGALRTHRAAIRLRLYVREFAAAKAHPASQKQRRGDFMLIFSFQMNSVTV